MRYRIQCRSSGAAIALINSEPTFYDPTEAGVSDAIFLILGLGFFVAASLYLFACERL